MKKALFDPISGYSLVKNIIFKNYYFFYHVLTSLQNLEKNNDGISRKRPDGVMNRWIDLFTGFFWLLAGTRK